MATPPAEVLVVLEQENGLTRGKCGCPGKKWPRAADVGRQLAAGAAIQKLPALLKANPVPRPVLKNQGLGSAQSGR